MGLKENIKKLRIANNWTQEQLADRVGVTRSTITQWETGWSKPRMGAVENLARAFGITESELLGDNIVAKPLNRRPVQGMPMASVPLRGRVHAGKPIEMDDLTGRDETVDIPQFLIERDPDVWAAESEGDCMNRVYPEGCIYVISPNTPHNNGRPEVWTIDDVDTVARRAYKTNNTLLLSPDSTNPENKDIIINAEDGHTASYDGRIVWFQSNGEVE